MMIMNFTKKYATTVEHAEVRISGFNLEINGIKFVSGDDILAVRKKYKGEKTYKGSDWEQLQKLFMDTVNIISSNGTENLVYVFKENIISGDIELMEEMF